MSFSPSFVLRSNNGTGEVYLSVQGNTVTEICLFASKISMEQYPLDIRWLAIKSGIWAVKEVTAEQFEQAKRAAFRRKQVCKHPLPLTPYLLPLLQLTTYLHF